MRSRRRASIFACAAAALALPRALRAEDKSDDKLQCLAASEQGQNQRDDGHYRAARESFLACARDACPKVIRQYCTRWVRDLDRDSPTVVLGARDSRGNDVTDVNVSLDGAPFATRLDGKPLEVDTGEHVLRFERPGGAPVEQKLVLRAGERARVVTVTLPSDEQPADTSAVEASAPAIGPGESRRAESLLSSRNVATAAIALGALGAGGTAAFFFVESGQNKDSAASLRSGLASNACSHAATTATCQSLGAKVDAQHRDATIGTTLLVGAGVLAAGAVATWLLWPQQDSSAPKTLGWIVVTPAGAMLQLAQSFR
jgi:hypothetical protein